MSKHHDLSNFMGSIVDLLRGPYRPPQYEPVMLPLVVLRRFDCALKPSKLFGWFKPNGELKDMTCRVALLRMQAQGLITLPASKIPVARRRPDFPATRRPAVRSARCCSPCTRSGP